MYIRCNVGYGALNIGVYTS